VRKPFDWTVYPYSKIARLPVFFQGPLLLLRNFIQKNPKPQFKFDGIETCHNMFFLKDPEFIKSQSRAILAGGFDYGIPLRLHQAIWCARYSIKKDPDACFVEFGTGKGFVMSAVMSNLTSFGNKTALPPTILFDSFQSSATDSLSLQSEANGKNIYYAESFDQVADNFKEWPNVFLVKGELPESLVGKVPEKISFLHVDLNSPLIEVECLRMCWSSIILGGVVLLDDYAYRGFEKTHEIITTFFDEIGYSILTTATGQGIVIK
jgi:O-methyltransferase